MKNLYDSYVEYLKMYNEIGTFGGMSEKAPLIKMLNEKEKITTFELTYNALYFFGRVLDEILPKNCEKAEEIIPYIRKMLKEFEKLGNRKETINNKEFVELLSEVK